MGWLVTPLSDGTVISGDSLGMVKFWDSRTCTQLQSFEAHGADVLCLVIGPVCHTGISLLFFVD
jgi:U3 small nucleolar RNA-associated protein 4